MYYEIEACAKRAVVRYQLLPPNPQHPKIKTITAGCWPVIPETCGKDLVETCGVVDNVPVVLLLVVLLLIFTFRNARNTKRSRVSLYRSFRSWLESLWSVG